MYKALEQVSLMSDKTIDHTKITVISIILGYSTGYDWVAQQTLRVCAAMRRVVAIYPQVDRRMYLRGLKMTYLRPQHKGIPIGCMKYVGPSWILSILKITVRIIEYR